MKYRITIDLDIASTVRATITTSRLDVDRGCMPAPETYSCTQPTVSQALRLALGVSALRLASALSSKHTPAPVHGVCSTHRSRRY